MDFVSEAWMYLQPIFDSPDIMKQLPTEGHGKHEAFAQLCREQLYEFLGKKFRLVDSKWRQASRFIARQSNCCDF